MKLLVTSDLQGDRTKYEELMEVTSRFNPDISIIMGPLLDHSNRSILNIHNLVFSNYDIMSQISKISKLLICFAGTDTYEESQYFDMNNKNNSIINCTNKLYSENIEIVFLNDIRPNKYTSLQWIKSDSRHDKSCNQSIEDTIIQKVHEVKNIGKSIWITYSIPSSLYPIEMSRSKYPFQLHYENKEFIHDSYSLRKLLEGDYSNTIQPQAMFSSFVDPIREINIKDSIHKKYGKCFCGRTGQFNTNILSYYLLHTHARTIEQWYHPIHKFSDI